MKVFIGFESSGVGRRAFQARGHFAVSVDLLAAKDGAKWPEVYGGHWQGDVFDVFDVLTDQGWEFDLGIFHPDCTYLTNSAAWAYKDGPYHQKVKPETLVGARRRAARKRALNDIRRIMALPIKRKCIENPPGAINSAIRLPDQTIQPNWFGDDASKATCLWLENLPLLTKTKSVPPRMVNGKPRWANQTDSGQNRLPPTPDRWQKRAETYPGIAAAFADQWGSL